MNFKKTLILVLGLLVIASPLWAQRSRSTQSSGASMDHRLEIVPLYGYAWTVSQSATITDQNNNIRTGDLDIKNSDFWGIAVDINAHPFAQLRLLYRRQDSQLTFKSAGTTDDVGDMSVEYWQIGGIKGMVKGNVRPYSGLTLGGTRYNTDIGDDWKFSIILSLGAKIYLNERIGLTLGGNMPWTFTDAFLGIGTGGLSVGGSGIVQFDVIGGLIVNI